MDLLVGYDGSPAANTAIRVGTRLFPAAHALITYVQTPPFAGRELRRRLRSSSRNLTELAETAEREGKHEAQLLVETGVALARSAGWDAEPLVKQVYSGEGIGLAQLAETYSPDAVVVGSRGLSGSEAVLGSVSELLVHHSPVPVVVSKQALLSSEYEALAAGPVVVGFDHSDGAAAALSAAQQLFPGRQLLAISVAADEPGSPTAGPPEDVTLVNAAPQRGRGAGATAHALLAVAAEHNAAAIVVGSRGRSALRQIVVGSVTRSLLRDSYRPVVVVPQGK